MKVTFYNICLKLKKHRTACLATFYLYVTLSHITQKIRIIHYFTFT